MKSTAFFKREAVNWILIVLPFIYLLVVYDRLPPFNPFPLSREQNIYYLLIFNTSVSLLGYLWLLIKPEIVPRTSLHENPKILYRIKTLLIGYITLLSLIYISEKIGISFNWSKIGIILAMAFMMVVGNFYPTIRFNFVIGIKNAWTLSNEHIWNKTHRFTGKVSFWGGLIGALYGILFDPFPVPYMPVIWVGYVFLLLFISHLYSYLIYRKMQPDQPEKSN